MGRWAMPSSPGAQAVPPGRPGPPPRVAASLITSPQGGAVPGNLLSAPTKCACKTGPEGPATGMGDGGVRGGRAGGPFLGSLQPALADLQRDTQESHLTAHSFVPEIRTEQPGKHEWGVVDGRWGRVGPPPRPAPVRSSLFAI